MIDKLLINSWTTESVNNFKSSQGFYSINFPSGWKRRKKKKSDNVEDFLNLKEVNGVLQISGYQHENESYVYNVDQELKEIKKENTSAQIVDFENESAIMYGSFEKRNNLLVYSFIFGKKRIKLLVTLIVPHNDKNQLDSDFNRIVNILHSLRIE